MAKYAGFAVLIGFAVIAVAIMQRYHANGCTKCINAMAELQQHRGTIHTRAWDMIG